ncbi:unnamed protein product [Amoebophrya sp. A120]|nr:unnamed protein product [Amoebophrya sp. A120]|eukprot:GSA120T00017373001.1
MNAQQNPQQVSRKEAQLRELSKLHALSRDVQVPKLQKGGYTTADVEAFKEAIDTHVEHHWDTAYARQERQIEARSLAKPMTSDQKRRFEAELGRQEEKLLQAEIGGWRTDDFSVVKTLGQGGFGVVRLVQHKQSKEVFAMKQMQKTAFPKKNDLARLMAERKCLVALGGSGGQYFVQLYACFADDHHLFMIMEFLQGGDLISLLCDRKRLSEAETRFYIAELIEALGFIHELGFVHRDIKPDNICFSRQGHLKLLDFGLCKEVVDHYKESADFLKQLPSHHVMYDDNDEKVTVGEYLHSLEQDKRRHLNSWVGTPQYMAPEIVNRETYTKAVDFWAAGVVMYDCLVGSTPFNPRVGEAEPPQIQKADAVTRVIYKIQKWQHYFGKAVQRGRQAGYLKDPAVELLNSLVTPVQQRLAFAQIKQHKFFQNLQFGNLYQQTAPIIPKVSSTLDTSKFPQHKETPLPHWQNLSRTMDRIRYENFDFVSTVNTVKTPPQVAQAIRAEHQMPTLLSSKPGNAHDAHSAQKPTITNKLPNAAARNGHNTRLVPNAANRR